MLTTEAGGSVAPMSLMASGPLVLRWCHSCFDIQETCAVQYCELLFVVAHARLTTRSVSGFSRF